MHAHFIPEATRRSTGEDVEMNEPGLETSIGEQVIRSTTPVWSSWQQLVTAVCGAWRGGGVCSGGRSLLLLLVHPLKTHNRSTQDHQRNRTRTL